MSEAAIKLNSVRILLVAVASAATATLASAQTGSNPIVLENQQPGSPAWMWSKLADDTNQQIKGYASSTSVASGETITFNVNVNPAQNYTIDFYRFGWYNGDGGRLRLRVGPLAGSPQPACPVDSSTGLIACAWAPAYTLTVPSDWTSGVYGALLTNEQGFQNYVIFVVRDGRPAPFLYQHSVATDQAYNNYPNDGVRGKSLYGWNSYGANTVGGTPGAVKVSYDRPMADSGIGIFFNWELNFVRWAERSGYDMTYSSNIDTHANGAELKNHKAFLSVGHDEYWTKEMYDAAESARDAGVNLGFFGGNAIYTQIRFEPSASGVPNRVQVCYRSYPWFPIDPVQGPTTTTEFRQPPVNRPEQTLMGVQYTVTHPNFDYVVTNSSHWVYAGTGVKDGDIVPGIVGYEADALLPNYTQPNVVSQTILSRSPYDENGVTKYTNSSIYQAPSGAWVFAAGTMSWSWALDEVPGAYRHFLVDARIQRATANVMDAFVNGFSPTITGFAPASGTAGSSVTISGVNLRGATAVTFNGSAATFTVTSDAAIQATVPAAATSGPISVTTPSGSATSSTSFTVVNPPTIASFTPTSGPAGATVTISGTHFTGATSVTFNGTAAAFTVDSDTSVRAAVPAGATTGPIAATTPDGTATSANVFTVTHPPVIAGFSPSSGPIGSTVAIAGANFSGATAVRFNGTAATFSVDSDTSLRATVPPGATTGSLSVTTPEGTANSSNAFTVTPPPSITSFTPPSGPTGASVTISGTHFTGVTSVTFNGAAATYTLDSDSSIRATVPVTTTGPISVTTGGGTANSGTAFTVIPPPTIAAFSPASGLTGSSVTITGTNFSSVTTVRFNGAAATFTVTSPTAIQATVPATATSGPLSVTTIAGTATSASPFTVRYTLTVAKTGLIGGTVTSNPAGINCGSTCSADFNSGTVVTLTPTPALLSFFNGWTGCDSVSGTTCTVAMTASKRVTASFVP